MRSRLSVVKASGATIRPSPDERGHRGFDLIRAANDRRDWLDSDRGGGSLERALVNVPCIIAVSGLTAQIGSSQMTGTRTRESTRTRA
jgi:hypothetical protein